VSWKAITLLQKQSVKTTEAATGQPQKAENGHSCQVTGKPEVNFPICRRLAIWPSDFDLVHTLAMFRWLWCQTAKRSVWFSALV